MSDEEVIEKLIPVRGIGRWTAEMFLIFSLGRLDVLPVLPILAYAPACANNTVLKICRTRRR